MVNPTCITIVEDGKLVSDFLEKWKQKSTNATIDMKRKPLLDSNLGYSRDIIDDTVWILRS